MKKIRMNANEGDSKREPHITDKRVGKRLRVRRDALGLSQEWLGGQLGLTFQQIQKYEKGLNRIGASRLWQLSSVLQVPVTYFFEDEPQVAVDGEHGQFVRFLSSPEAVRLNQAFMRVRDVKVRRRVLDLVLAMSHEGALPVEATDGPHYCANAFEPRAA